ncbi:unnamed protein product [Owenia fusiformis]|uniref:DOMON domain-containing protein n=1 Tax=Owenia fusiformis TaxID=6347 RepID=A0A8S4Q1X0_OWEFU|nr:unnamed protein product [Owenia fusiformis]
MLRCMEECVRRYGQVNSTETTKNTDSIEKPNEDRFLRKMSHLLIKYAIVALFLIIYGATGNVSSAGPVVYDKDLEYESPLDQEHTMYLKWGLDNSERRIVFQVYAKIAPDDWLAFGFSDYGESFNADLFLFWTDVDGGHHFQDTYSDRTGILHVDKNQDFDLLEADTRPGRVHIPKILLAKEETPGGYVILTFQRKWDTCDSNDYIIDSGTTHVIFFTGTGPINAIEGMNVTSHMPGLQRLQLLKSPIHPPKFPPDTKMFEMLVENVPIPAKETTYWCRTKKLPKITEKHHIIQFEGVISHDSIGIVHHMEVFHCEVPPDEEIPHYNEPCPGEGSSMKPWMQRIGSCRRVIGAWAMGAGPFWYPEEAGYPIGGADFSRYVMIEVHFNNPTLKKGIIDNSGIRFYYTPTMRPHDAGVMELGLEYIDKMAVPPHVEDFELEGYCIPKCTKVGLPRNGIHIFGSQLHTHLTGKRVVTKHYRDGVELPELNRDNHYSPHFQEIRILHSPVHVRQGDELITTCTHNTMSRPNITFGGFAISDEMCVNYIHYYPKSKLEVCKSSIATDALEKFFDTAKRLDDRVISPMKVVSKSYKSVRWDRVTTNLLEAFYMKEPISMQCNQSDGHRFPGHWDDSEIPKITHPLPTPLRHCPP